MIRVVKYGAGFCMQCKLQDKEFSENEVNAELKIRDVDSLTYEETEKLHIRNIPVTLVYENNNESNISLQELEFENPDFKEIKRWVGFIKVSEINQFIDQYLKNKANE